MSSIFARIAEYTTTFTTCFSVGFGEFVLFRGCPTAGVSGEQVGAAFVGEGISLVITWYVGMSFDPFQGERTGPVDVAEEGLALLGRLLIGMGFG